MKNRIVFFAFISIISVTTFAQTSNGQIRRENKTSKLEVKQIPSNNNKQNVKKKRVSIVSKKEESRYIQTNNQIISLINLSTYNVVGFSAWSLEKAQDKCVFFVREVIHQ